MCLSRKQWIRIEKRYWVLLNDYYYYRCPISVVLRHWKTRSPGYVEVETYSAEVTRMIQYKVLRNGNTASRCGEARTGASVGATGFERMEYARPSGGKPLERFSLGEAMKTQRRTISESNGTCTVDECKISFLSLFFVDADSIETKVIAPNKNQRRTFIYSSDERSLVERKARESFVTRFNKALLPPMPLLLLISAIETKSSEEQRAVISARMIHTE